MVCVKGTVAYMSAGGYPTVPLRHTSGVPFQAKGRKPGVDKAIKAFLAAADAVQDLDLERQKRIAARAKALAAALEQGATLAELARLRGVTPERIRQMK